MANDLGFLKVWANANKSKQTTKRSLSEFLNEPEYELTFEDGTNLGAVGFSAYQAIKENRLDSYTPYNEEEKKIIDKYRLYTGAELTKDDGTSLGFISKDGLKAIEENNTENYTPVNDEEKTTINSYIEYATQKRQERIDQYKDSAKKELADIEKEKSELADETSKLRRSRAIASRAGKQGTAWEIKDTRTPKEKREGKPIPKSEGMKKLKSLENEYANLDEKADALVETISDIDKYANVVYKETGWWNQAKANYTQGRLSQDTAQAYNDYISSQTEENKMRADALSALSEQFNINNQKAFTTDDENVGKVRETVRDFVSVSFARYLPQLVDQTKASVKGAAIGGATGAVVGSVVPVVGTATGLTYGLKAGWVAGASKQMFDTTRGMVFKTLIDAGYDEETALDAATDEAFVSSVIEGCGEIISMATLGTGKLVGKIAPKTTQKISSNIITKGVKGFVKKTGKTISENVFLKTTTSVAGVLVNAIGEYAEEYSQEAVSIANERRLQNGSSLIGETISVLRDKSDETSDRLHTAGREGFKIGLMMGGATKVGTTAFENAIISRTGKKIKEFDSEQSGLVQSIIDVGLKHSPKTLSHKLATKLNQNDKISNYELGKLVNANKQETVNVGDTYYDTQNKVTYRVVSRDENATIIEAASPDGKTITKAFPNHNADNLTNNNRFVIVDIATGTAVAEENTVTETPTVEQTTPVATDMYNMLVGEKLTNKAIDNIISTPELRGAFEQLTGIEIKGTKAEQRAIVRNFQNDAQNIENLKAKNSGVAVVQNATTNPSVKVGDVYTANGKTYTITDRDDRYTTYTVTDENGDVIRTEKIGNVTADINFTKEEAYTKVQDGNAVSTTESKNASTTDESISGVNRVSGDSINPTGEEISLVVDAMNETLKAGALDAIYESMPSNIEKSLDTFAKSLIKLYKKHGNIGHIADFFSDGGKKVISAIENTLSKSNLDNKLDNKTVVETTQNAEDVLKNQSESVTIEEKTTTKIVPDADKSHTVAYTNDNQKIDLTYKVVDVKDLIVSNSLDGKVNPNYPQELQPRDRSRTSSQSQIRQMAANLNPARLEESTSVSEGSPIIGPDNVVESGNGRTLAIELAYKNGTADEYRKHIINNADKYGLDASNLPENPVLVRERITEVDRIEFTRKANESSIGSLSATEQARVDAEKLTEDVLNLLVANDDGIINTSDNKDFITAVITKVFKNEDLNNVVGAEGRLSARGLERITNAIFYKAYGDASLSARLSESLDNDMKNATKVLLNIAPRIVSIKNGISSGDIYAFDFSADIVNAIKLFEKCRNENTTLENYAAQESLFEKEPELTLAMAYVFETKNRGAKQATEFYNLLLDTVEELGNPNQISLDVVETFQTKGEILNATVKKFNNRVEPKNALAIPENIYRPESEKGREDDRRGIDEVSGNEPNQNKKTGNAVGVQPDNRRSEETGVVANDEQLRQENESVERQSKIEREENGNERRSNSLSGNGRWGHNGSTRKQTGRISYFERKNQGRNAAERQNFARELIQREHTEEVTERIGKHTYKYTLVKSEAYNDDMKSMVEDAKRKGVELDFFVGNAKVNFDNKGEFVIDGIKFSDTRVLVQYDATRTPQILAKHEIAHAKWNTPAIQKIKNIILDNLSESDKNEILSRERMQRYQSTYKDDAGQPKMDIVWEEYVCDVMSGMVEDTANYIDVVTDYWYGNEAVDSYNVAEYSESIDAGDRYSLLDDSNYNESSYPVWAKDVLDVFELGKLESALLDIESGINANYYTRSASGEYIIQTDNKLIYTNGNYSKPKISKIIEFNSEYETEIDEMRRRIYEVEKGKSELEVANRIIERTYGQGSVIEHTGHSNSTNGKSTGPRKGTGGKGNSHNGTKKQRRSRYVEEIRGASKQGLKAIQKASRNLKKNGVRYSIADVDSNGNTLTESQQEYFKDSKVRDENGNLLVMYHGTPNAGFTQFRTGTYFTEHKWYADRYQGQGASSLSYKKTADNPDTYAVYLNIKKPFDTRNKAERDIFHNEYYRQYGTGTDLMESGLPDWMDGGDLQEFLEEKGYDYDGLILDEGAVGGYGEEVVSRGLAYVTFRPEQVKNVDNLNPTSAPDIRFSLTQPVEETKNLIAVHNLSPAKLLKTLKLGGLPMPSIAITRAKDGWNNFGDISLVFNKDTIDPQFMRRNKVYSGDAWTPTYPQVAYKVNEKAQEQIRKKINGLVPKNIQDDLGGLHLDAYNMEDDLNRHGDMSTSYRYNYAMKYAFLKDNNVSIELPTKEEPFYRYGEVSNDAVVSFAHKLVDGLKTANSLLEQHSSKLMEDTELLNSIAMVLNEEVMATTDKNSVDYQNLAENPLFKPEEIDLSTVLGMLEAARKYFRSNGKVESRVDYQNAKGKIDDYFDSHSLEPEYEYWLKKLFSDIVAKEGIRNNRDLFTPSGNRRSFEALHYEHNLENVIKAMKEQGDTGVGAFGGGNILGAATREYDSIADIKTDAQNRMEQLPESQYDEIRKGFTDRLFELASSLPINKDSFSAIDSAANMLIEAVSKYKTKSGMANYLRKESQGWANYNDSVVDELIELVSDIRQAPVSYFEAKPQRAVGFDEIKAVIMPTQSSYEDDLSEVKGELEKVGVPILEYEYGDNNSRLKALNSLEDVRFSVADANYAPTFYSHMGKTIDEMKQEKIGTNSVVSYLKGRGVKDEEIKWSGIETFLDGKKSVTKAELQEFVAGSQLQIETETRSSDYTISYTEDENKALDEISRVTNEIWQNIDALWMDKYGEEIPWDIRYNDNAVSAMYREINKLQKTDAESGDFFNDIIRSLNRIEVLERNLNNIVQKAKNRTLGEKHNTKTKWDKYTLDGGSNYRELLFKLPNSTYTNDSMRTHWGNAEGVLAHARIQDFDVDGEKMLFIEEIQSDWHNEGMSKGYKRKLSPAEEKTVIDITDKRTKLFNELRDVLQEIREIQAQNPDNQAETTNTLWAKANKLRAEERALKEEAENIEGLEKSVPDAPFRNNYHEFVLKNLIRMAAEQGYDSIGWTTADIQSERWSDEYAEGYRIEYDQDIPKFLNKYGKKWGAKVEKTEIGKEDGDLYEVEGTMVWSMPITDSMKESVLYEGQARYSLATDGIPDLEDLWKYAIEEYGTIPKGEMPARETVHYSKQSVVNNSDTENKWTTKQVDAVDDNTKGKDKLVSIADIVNTIREKFDIPVATGKVTNPEASGLYKEKAESIRIRLANNLPTISHELGHHLDKRYKLSKLDSVKTLRKSVSEDFLKQYPDTEKDGEAVAEFVRQYLKNTNEANRLCPEFYNEFVRALSNEDLKAVNEIANTVNEYMSYDFSGRVRAAIVSGDVKEKTSLREKAKEMHANWIDGFLPIKDVVEYVEETTGTSLSGRQNAYTLATNSLNARAIANFNTVHGFRDLNGNIIDGAKSYIECIANVDSKDLGTLDEYLVLKHSLEWIAPKNADVATKRVFADDTLEDVESIEKRIAMIEANFPKMKEAAENLYEYQRNILKYIVMPAGGMTEDTFNSLNEKYPCYVPFYRAIGKDGAKTKGSFANQKSPIKRARGSGELILSPLESIIKNTDKMVKFALRNQTMQVLASYADTVDGFGKFMEKVPPDMLPHTTDITLLKNEFEDALQQAVSSGEDYFAVSGLFDEIFGNAVTDFTPIANSNKKIVTVLNNGTFSYYQIHDEDLYDAVAEFTPKNLKGILALSHKLMQPMKLLITQSNPIFGTTNFLRDIGTAYKHSPINNPAEFAMKYVLAAKEVITKGDMYKQWQAMGGGHNSELSADLDQIKVTLRQVAQKDMGKARRLLYSIICHPITTVASLNDYIESTPRFMEFKRTLESGGDLQEAIYNADDITTNFKRSGKGSFAKDMNALVMFNNAALQGLDKTARTLTNKNKVERNKTLLKWALSALLMAVIQAFWNKENDDEGYENLSSYTKNNFYNFSVGDGKFISIPKARETALLDSFTERTIEYVFGNDDAFYEFGAYALEQILPPMIPNSLNPVDAAHDVLGSTVIGGLADVGWNKNYMDVPIEGKYDEDSPSNERYNEKTTMVAYALGQTKLARMADISPKKIDHLISSYTGIIGQANKALFPMNKENIDATIGLRNKFLKDSNYSTDLLNKAYDNRDKAKLQWQYDNNINNAIEYEQNEVITSYISGMNKAIKALPESEQREGRKYLLKTLNEWDYNLSASQQDMISRLEKESISKDYIFEELPSSEISWTQNKKKYTYQMTPQEYNDYINKYLTAIDTARKKSNGNYTKAKESAKDVMSRYKKRLTSQYRSKATKVE